MEHGAAVSAARLGLHVILLQDRFLLGGNNSRDVRVHLQGLMNLPPYPNLGNLIYQFQPKQEGNAQPGEFYEDAKKLEIVRAEKNLSLFLGTRVIGVEKEGMRITAVIAKNLLTGKEERFRGHLFADCSGDGNLGFLAGADWRMGRESREETGESCAPEIADSMTMGASIQWFAVETDEETTFPELPWAIQFTSDSIKPSTHGDWDWETGMNLDQINDIERIRDNGLRAAYGHWSYMKNDSDADWREKVRKMKLGWVSFTAGKRESRRLLGDVILQEQDIREGKVWPDGTVTTTWPIDLHYPEESNQKFFPGEEFRAICKTIQSPPYAIPYRCFYSRNIENLFMAGRDISVTHAALGTVRVMRTGGMMGEVVGMAAAVCREHNALPRDVYEKYFEELREKMTVGVAPPVPGQMEVKEPDWAKDLENIAPKATVTASTLGENGNRPVSLLIDGKANPDDPNGFFLTEKGKVHFVRFDFPDPVTITGIHFVSGNLDPTKLNHYVLQYFDGKDWIDVPEAFIKNRWGLDYSLTFPPIQAESFRLLQEFYYSLEPLRLWEVELFAEKTDE